MENDSLILCVKIREYGHPLITVGKWQHSNGCRVTLYSLYIGPVGYSRLLVLWKWRWTDKPIVWAVLFDCYWPLGFCMSAIVRLSLKWLSCGAKHLECWTGIQGWPLPCPKPLEQWLIHVTIFCSSEPNKALLKWTESAVNSMSSHRKSTGPASSH